MKRPSWLQVDPKQATALDYVLIAIAEVCAAYSVTQAFNVDSLIPMFCGTVAIGFGISYLVSRVLRVSWLIKLDGVLFAVAALIALSATKNLNDMLPQNPFQNQLIIASAMTWLMIAGSFFAWRDGSMLFGAVPAVALFGLIGVYDTYSNVVWVFFAFILCLAMLFGRAHSRQMTYLAEASGFQRVQLLREGPWRWMAGAEWAVGSAVAIIFMSLLGAPVIRKSTASINGFAKSNLIPKPAVSAEPSVARTEKSQVGQGPSTLGDQVVFKAKLDEPMYLRTMTYNDFEDGAWSFQWSAGKQTVGEISLTEVQKHGQTFDFTLRPVVPMTSLPVPGEATHVSIGAGDFNFDLAPRGNGTYEVRRDVTDKTIRGQAVRPSPTFQPTKAGQLFRLADYTSVTGLSNRVIEQARTVAKSGSDYEKAEAIKKWIEGQAKYDLRAPAVPKDVDPVEYFLFDSKRGYCDLFATSMVMMARSAGIPARYAVGYYPVRGEQDEAGNYVLRQKDGHAWAELFFEGVGWIPFDATEGAQEVEGGKRGESFGGQSGTLREIAFAGIGVVVLGGLVRMFMRRRKNTGEEDPREVLLQRVGRVYARFERILVPLVGRPRRLGQTPAEYLENAKPKLDATYEIARRINEKFEQAMFSPEHPHEAEIEQLTKEVAHLKELVESRKSKL